MKPLCRFFALLCIITRVAVDANILDVFFQCPQQWRSVTNRTSLVCDPENLLNNVDIQKNLENLLTDIQWKTPCLCPRQDDCFREGNLLQSSYAAAILVVEEIESDVDLELQAAMVYEKLELGGAKDCDNGILIIYAAEPKFLYTYRGVGTYAALSESELKQIHVDIAKLPKDSFQEDDAKNPLYVLLRRYHVELLANTRIRDRSWEILVGMAVACVIFVAILAVLLALCCDRLCGKTKREKETKAMKRDVSIFTATHQSQEPLYVVTEPTGTASLHGSAVLDPVSDYMVVQPRSDRESQIQQRQMTLEPEKELQ